MQLTTDQRPKFLRSFLDALGKEAEITGWRAVIPYALLPCVALAVAVAYFMPATFWSTHDQEMAVVVYSGILTFNGLILTLGWSAFSRIYDVLLRGDFGKYVMRAGLLADYLLQITYMHIFQVAAVIFSAAGLVSILLDSIPMWIGRSVFGITIALTMYAIKQAANAVTAMNDLVWQSAYFESNRPQSGPGNVVGIGDR
jgi:hypothetical protein